MKIKLDDGAIMPERAHESDAGLDLFAMKSTIIPAGDWRAIDTGVHVEIPHGYVGLLTSKSGLMRKSGLTCRGTIDCGYTGSIQAIVFNHGTQPFVFRRGQKVTQLVLLPCLLPELEVVESLDDTDRGEGGFGSTGA